MKTSRAQDSSLLIKEEEEEEEQQQQGKKDPAYRAFSESRELKVSAGSSVKSFSFKALQGE